MPRVRVFVDANTIVSGLIFEGNEAQLLELGIVRALELVTSQYVIEEVRKALSREEFGNTEEDIADFLGYLQEAVLMVADSGRLAIEKFEPRLRDKKDAAVWAAFEASGARHLVTGDKELLDKVKGAVKTRVLLARLSRGEL